MGKELVTLESCEAKASKIEKGYVHLTPELLGPAGLIVNQGLTYAHYNFFK